MPDDVPKLDVNDLRTYRAHWDRVGPVLEKLRRRELRMMTEEQHRQALVDVMDAVLPAESRRQAAKDHVAGWADFQKRVFEKFSAK